MSTEYHEHDTATLPATEIIAQEGDQLVVLPPEAWPSVDHLITEDDTPVDNIFSEKQQRLLTECLYTSWAGPGRGRPFVALANVGLFYNVEKPPLVPDVLLSLDVRVPPDLWEKINRSYFLWKYGKPPDVVIEIVSNRKGNEDEHKVERYAEIGIRYYAIFDPSHQLSPAPLRLYERKDEPGKGKKKGKATYEERKEMDLPGVGLGLQLWHGEYENVEATWLRWCDERGNLLATGEEQRRRAEQEQRRAEQEQRRAEQEQRRAEQEQRRAEQERRRAERLAARLRELGIDPDQE